MLRWASDEKLTTLLRRYYTGEAGLWEEIRSLVDDELRRHNIQRGAYQLRFRKRKIDYEIIVEDASDFAVDN